MCRLPMLPLYQQYSYIVGVLHDAQRKIHDELRVGTHNIVLLYCILHNA